MIQILTLSVVSWKRFLIGPLKQAKLFHLQVSINQCLQFSVHSMFATFYIINDCKFLYNQCITHDWKDHCVLNGFSSDLRIFRFAGDLPLVVELLRNDAVDAVGDLRAFLNVSLKNKSVLVNHFHILNDFLTFLLSKLNATASFL